MFPGYKKTTCVLGDVLSSIYLFSLSILPCRLCASNIYKVVHIFKKAIFGLDHLVFDPDKGLHETVQVEVLWCY